MVKKFNLFLLALIFAIVIMGLVIANHVVTPASYNYNDSASNLYNITINNTDTTANANITIVNITLPSGFVFVSGSNWTDAINSSFTSFGNSNLSWSNSAGLVMNLSLQMFAFQATSSTPGNYNITVTTTNVTGIYSSNISVIINDTTAPMINYTTSPASGSNTSAIYVIFNLTAQDYSGIDTFILRVYNTTSGLINQTIANATQLPIYLNISNLTTEGIYSYNITVNDTRNNVNNSETRTWRIDTTAPSVSLSENADTETTLNITITINDGSGSGIGSTCTDSDSSTTISGTGTTQYLYDSSLDCETSYSYNVTCTDRVGNSRSASGSGTTESCSDSGDGSGSGDSGGDDTGSFWISTYNVNDTQFSGGYTKWLLVGYRFGVTVGSETHYVGVIRITSTKVTINVSSAPQQAILSKGASKDFEVSGDSYYDIRVTLNDINASGDYKANLTVLKIHEKVPATITNVTTGTGGANVSGGTMNETAATNESGKGFFSNVWEKASGWLPSYLKNKWLWIGVVVLAAVIVGGVWFVKKPEKIEKRVKLKEF